MDPQSLSTARGSVIALGPHREFPRRVRYEYIRMRISDTRETTLRNVTAATDINRHLAPGKPVSLFLIRSPSGEIYVFAIDADGQRTEVIGLIGEEQARARKQAVKWLIISIPLCLVLIGLLLLATTIQGLILLRRAPKPHDMHAYLAAHPPVRDEAPASPA